MFELKINRRNVPVDELLEDVRLVAEKLNTINLTRDQYNEHGKFSSSTLERRVGKWSEILKKVGLKVKNPIHNSNETLFANLGDVWTLLGRQPRYSELSKEISKFSVGTYENRFGSWNQALQEFIQYINGEETEVLLNEFKTDKENLKRTPRNINWRLRAKILIRDNCICKMCGTSPAKDADVILHVDHVKPYSKGGETLEENLRTLCHKCNIGKSDMETEDIK